MNPNLAFHSLLSASHTKRSFFLFMMPCGTPTWVKPQPKIPFKHLNHFKPGLPARLARRTAALRTLRCSAKRFTRAASPYRAGARAHVPLRGGPLRVPERRHRYRLQWRVACGCALRHGDLLCHAKCALWVWCVCSPSPWRTSAMSSAPSSLVTAATRTDSPRIRRARACMRSRRARGISGASLAFLARGRRILGGGRCTSRPTSAGAVGMLKSLLNSSAPSAAADGAKLVVAMCSMQPTPYRTQPNRRVASCGGRNRRVVGACRSGTPERCVGTPVTARAFPTAVALVNSVTQTLVQLACVCARARVQSWEKRVR